LQIVGLYNSYSTFNQPEKMLFTAAACRHLKQSQRPEKADKLLITNLRKSACLWSPANYCGAQLDSALDSHIKLRTKASD